MLSATGSTSTLERKSSDGMPGSALMAIRPPSASHRQVTAASAASNRGSVSGAPEGSWNWPPASASASFVFSAATSAGPVAAAPNEPPGRPVSVTVALPSRRSLSAPPPGTLSAGPRGRPIRWPGMRTVEVAVRPFSRSGSGCRPSGPTTEKNGTREGR
ncbi:hypothetical protein D7Y13_33950 [Corallococcus praedator]|uniref:Uncharacterized protein n=2 Tax=Corallococcus praedator TaxID=2316724 RepID=A0ABX9Q7P2_9BACT|nr:hypothetical protein D7Y13_33950 [Corallococcus praedator]